MDADFNTGAAIAELFQLASLVGKAAPAEQDTLRRLVRDLGRLIGLFQPGDGRDTAAAPAGAADERLAAAMAVIIELRQKARANRDFATSDLIRDRLKAAGITIKDGKDGATWE
jgi:cysteinyl-tRNA synthetase